MDSEEAKELNAEYVNNSVLVKALIHFLPGNERYKIMKWIQKITLNNEDIEQMQIRNEYMWILLLILQNGVVTPPFDNYPPPCPLPPLCSILPPKFYKIIRRGECKESTWKRDEVQARVRAKLRSVKEMEPWEFFNRQPKPESGSFCYACVFSDFT